MTDEEITRRLAEIEGHKPTGDDYSPNFGLWCSGGNPYFGVECRGEVWPFNPLMFDQQCMALVKKYHLSLFYYPPETNGYGETSKAEWSAQGNYPGDLWSISPESTHESLNHAVCLAIIEAHNAPD